MTVTIISYESRHAGRFRDLNLAWLEKFFRVEEKDRQLLEQSEQNIITPGGKIFLAAADDEIIGCFALIRIGDGIYELGKMAVDPLYQGRRIGQELLRYAIEYAREQQWKKIVLYSHTKLENALHIYRKYGFREVALEKDLPYERSDIKMELTLGE